MCASILSTLYGAPAFTFSCVIYIFMCCRRRGSLPSDAVGDPLSPPVPGTARFRPASKPLILDQPIPRRRPCVFRLPTAAAVPHALHLACSTVYELHFPWPSPAPACHSVHASPHAWIHVAGGLLGPHQGRLPRRRSPCVCCLLALWYVWSA